MPRHYVIGLIAVLLAGLVAVGLSAERPLLPPRDFPQYWAAGRLNLHGENPYDGAALRRLQEGLAPGQDLVMMWLPPWALALVMPVGALPGPLAQLLWLAAQVALGVGAALLARRVYGGETPAAVAVLLPLAFAPLWEVVRYGQISPVILFGLAGFLPAGRAGRPFLAGVAVSLAGVKPHIIHLFWPILLLDSLRRRNFAALLGGLTAGTAATALALAFNPELFAQYAESLARGDRDPGHVPITAWRSPTAGTLLRVWFGVHHFWLQFVPTALAQLWGLAHWWRHRRHWDWEDQLPLLTAVSLATAPYGAWKVDLVLLLLPALHVVCRLGVGGRRGAAWWLAGLVVFDLLVEVLPDNERLASVTWAALLAYAARRWAASGHDPTRS